MPRLIVEAGRQIGCEFEVAPRMTLGRLETCTAMLQDENASREHAAIRLLKERYYIFDLDSRNGTTLNGKKVQRAPLVPGDRIGIGDTTLLFYDNDHSVRPEDTLGDEELRRASVEAEALEDEETMAPKTPVPRAPPVAQGEAAPRPAAPAPPPSDPATSAGGDALEAALFALLLVLTFLCASYATQILLRLLTA